jgi:hypothetical protein
MDKKRIVEQAKDLAIANWRDKIIRLNRLETDIQGMIREFVEITGV